MRSTKLLFVLSLFLHILFIQLPALSEDSIVDLPILPDDLFSQKNIPNPCPFNESTKPKRYMIFWDDRPAIDGSFILVIHPTQIFLRSSHDNPNPDCIYWMSPISASQYQALSGILDQYKEKIFSQKNVWNWGGYKIFRFTKAKQSPYMTGTDWDAWHLKVDKTIESNMSQVFSELNRAFPKGVPKLNLISIPSISTHTVYIDDYRAPKE